LNRLDLALGVAVDRYRPIKIIKSICNSSITYFIIYTENHAHTG